MFCGTLIFFTKKSHIFYKKKKLYSIYLKAICRFFRMSLQEYIFMELFLGSKYIVPFLLNFTKNTIT